MKKALFCILAAALGDDDVFAGLGLQGAGLVPGGGRKGSKWFIGGITTGTERDFRIRLDFLSPGRHRMTAFKDGLNAGYQAMHYNKVEKNVDSTETVDIHMARNGGWAAVIE